MLSEGIKKKVNIKNFLNLRGIKDRRESINIYNSSFLKKICGGKTI